MMITVSDLEAIIAQALPGEQVQYDGKPIGSIDQMTKKLNERIHPMSAALRSFAVCS
jgi:hypothetical protein